MTASSDPLTRVREAATDRGLEIELRERPQAHSLVEAAEMLGIQPSDIVKTLVVKRPSTGSGTAGAGTGSPSTGSGTAGAGTAGAGTAGAGTAGAGTAGAGTAGTGAAGAGADGEYLFALVPGGRSISWPKLRALVGVNKLRLPEPELALAATGYERGTIVPVGSTTDWPVYADETIRGKRIAMGAGAHGYSLFVDADELIAAYGATVADISVEETPRD